VVKLVCIWLYIISGQSGQSGHNARRRQKIPLLV